MRFARVHDPFQYLQPLNGSPRPKRVLPEGEEVRFAVSRRKVLFFVSARVKSCVFCVREGERGWFCLMQGIYQLVLKSQPPQNCQPTVLISNSKH